MPPTATLEDIKAHQQKIEKGKITPHNLPPCPRCHVDSGYFKVHAFRERWFLMIVDMFVKKAACPLVRFRCPGCGKTFTAYPDFAVPYKRYTRQSVMGFCARYVENDEMTYRKATMIDGSVPGYPQSDATLAPSTIHRWITTFGRFSETCRTALGLLLQENPVSGICRDLGLLTVPRRKHTTDRRKKQLVGCRRLVGIEAFFQVAFKTSIFTKLATRCGFS